MKKLILSLVLLFAASAQAQTAAQAAQARNNVVCGHYDTLSKGCTDGEVMFAWCDKNNVQKSPAGMCAAVADDPTTGKRPSSEKILTTVQYMAELVSQESKDDSEKAKVARKKLLLLLEIALLDDTVRVKVCADAGIAAQDCK